MASAVRPFEQAKSRNNEAKAHDTKIPWAFIWLIVQYIIDLTQVVMGFAAIDYLGGDRKVAFIIMLACAWLSQFESDLPRMRIAESSVSVFVAVGLVYSWDVRVLVALIVFGMLLNGWQIWKFGINFLTKPASTAQHGGDDAHTHNDGHAHDDHNHGSHGGHDGNEKQGKHEETDHH